MTNKEKRRTQRDKLRMARDPGYYPAITEFEPPAASRPAEGERKDDREHHPPQRDI